MDRRVGKSDAANTPAKGGLGTTLVKALAGPRCRGRSPQRPGRRERVAHARGLPLAATLTRTDASSAPRLKNRLDFCRKGRIAMGAGRWTWPPGETLRARLAMCGALGRASVNSGAANQRSPNDVDPFHKIPEHEERRT
jgi:hypothetical protein